MAFTAVLISVLTCVELPSLRPFVHANTSDLFLPFFGQVYHHATSLAMRNAVTGIIGLLSGHGASPLHHVYIRWLGLMAVSSRAQLAAVDPLDPAFPALVLEMGPEIGRDCETLRAVSEKAVYAGRSPAVAFAIQELVPHIDAKLYYEFCAMKVPTTQFLPAVALLAEMPPAQANQQIAEETLPSVLESLLLSEAPQALVYAAKLAKSFGLVRDKALAFVAHRTLRRERAFLRLVLVVTNWDSFGSFLAGHPKLSEEIAQGVGALIGEKLGSDAFAAICIAWHNIAVCVKEGELRNHAVDAIFRRGGEFLLAEWSAHGEHGELLAEAVADALTNVPVGGVVRTMVQAVKELPAGLADRFEGEGKGEQAGSWGPERWMDYVTGSVYVIQKESVSRS
jgi:hypothetical protein